MEVTGNNIIDVSNCFYHDSWGRLLTLTYPDGEAVAYHYGFGGALDSVTGDKGSAHYRYVTGITYNDFGQRSGIDYAGGTHADYAYDALHRLAQLTSVSPAGDMQRVDYTTDGAGNIGLVQNTAPPVGTMGGPYTSNYTYDALDRLTGSASPDSPYDIAMAYSPSGRLAARHAGASADFPMAVEARYGYCPEDKPHAPRRIFDQGTGKLAVMLWDAAGNLGQVAMADGNACHDTRFLFWTTDSRLHTVADTRKHSYYAYDHAGERTVKLTGDNNVMDVSAERMSSAATLDDATLYPSPYIVVTGKGYTKHYYVGGDRLCARIGGGGLLPPAQDAALSGKAADLLGQCMELCDGRTLTDVPAECVHGLGWDGEELRQQVEDIPARLKAGVVAKPEGIMTAMAYCSTHNDKEPDVYFYHSDHLGSASWITDGNGQPVQHLQYLPFGERHVSQRLTGTTYSERFTFTGKERDAETGYSYFSARYYDPETCCLWLSVDPMADKYPGINPYAYCAWNPVKLVDPDGRENIIYVVYLQGKNGSVDVNKIIKETNIRFEALGLETRAVLAPDGAYFNPSYMDKTDSYALIGDVAAEKEFININSPSKNKNFKDWLGGTDHPEKSVNDGSQKGNIICIDASALNSAGARIGTDSEEMCAFLIMHGAGHNAGFNHSNETPTRYGQTPENTAIMMGGSASSWMRRRGTNFIMSISNNSKYIDRMKEVFGNNKAVSHYEIKKKKALDTHIRY